MGTRQLDVHPLATNRRPSGRRLSGHALRAVHAPQSMPCHPGGQAGVVALSSGEASDATQCAQLAGCGLSEVNSEVLCLHGGSWRSYGFLHSGEDGGEGGEGQERVTFVVRGEAFRERDT